MITLIDTGLGNKRSLQTALIKCGAEVEVTSDLAQILEAPAAVLAGVGAFDYVMPLLEETGIADVLKERYRLQRPILGVCLGMQVFYQESMEHKLTPGLGFLKGRIRRLDPGPGFKVPHIGWDTVQWRNDSALGAGADNSCSYYYLHAYAAELSSDPESVHGISTHGDQQFVAAVEQHPLYGVQFHPENSSSYGLTLLKNFVDLCAIDQT